MSALPLFDHQPQADGWIAFPTLGPCPVPDETLVMLRYRNGWIVGPVQAGKRRWARFPKQQSPLPGDIVAWRYAPGEA